jgi:predicted nucleic acid-binding protein
LRSASHVSRGQNSIQSELNLPWSLWDDIVIAAHMRRLKIKKIYLNDEDLDRIPWIKGRSRTTRNPPKKSPS